MSISQEKISIGALEIDVIRKDIKNMHLAVYPPHGRIRLSAPNQTDAEVMRLFAISKLGWIKKHVKNFNAQPREAARVYSSGESHYFQGRRYLLDVIDYKGYAKVTINTSKKRLLLYIHSDASKEDREKVIKEWYRKELKKQIPALITKWEQIIGVQANDWGVKLMRTKWGACNIEEKRIWLNLELAKKPEICLEYIICHELVHLLERNHNERFVKYMDQFMPKWRQYRDELNALPVAHTDWGY